MSPINANEFMARLKNGDHINLLDVREEIEYATYNIGGKNMPLSKLPHSIVNWIITKRMKLLLYVRSACAAKRRGSYSIKMAIKTCVIYRAD